MQIGDTRSIACGLLLSSALVVGCAEATGSPPEEDPEGEPLAAEYRSARVELTVEAASSIVQTRGFAPIGEEWRGFLVDHAADVREQAMRAGNCYLLLAAGSAAMRQLDIRIFDSDGSEIIQDGSEGPSAALTFCPAQSGTYYVTVHASLGSGLFEARAFRGPTGLDVRIDDLFREGPAPEETPR